MTVAVDTGISDKNRSQPSMSNSGNEHVGDSSAVGANSVHDDGGVESANGKYCESCC